MKKLFAFMLLAAFMIAFSPPGYSSSPPIHPDKVYVIDSPVTVSAPANVAVVNQVYDFYSQTQTGTMQFVKAPEIKVSSGSGLVCGFARNAVLQNEPSYDSQTLPIITNLRTCHNLMDVQNSSILNRPYIHNQPRDGLTTAAA